MGVKILDYKYVFVQVLKLRPALWSFILQSECTDLEHFSDAVEETATSVRDGTSEGEEPKEGSHGNSNRGHTGVGGNWNKEEGEPPYNINHRNPLHCGAESTCLWELERVRSQPCCLQCVCIYI